MDPFKTKTSTPAINVTQGEFATSSTPVQQATQSQSSIDAINAYNSQFRIDVPEIITTEQGTSTEEVLNFRAQAEAETAPQPNILDGIEQRSGTPIEISRFDDYNAVIENAPFGEREQTDAEMDRQKILDNYANRVANIQSDINLTEEQASERYTIAQKERDLAETNVRIAEKTRALRERLRRFDTTAEQRGVAREFVVGSRQKIEADATAELADEYIIQAAQMGNLQRAEQLVQTAVDNRVQAFQLQNQADQARLDALIPTLEGEEKQRAQQLAFALQERERNIEEIKVEQEGIHNMMITAATNGASGDVQRQILGAKTLDEAMALAGPYIGRYERMKAESTLANQALQRRETLAKLAISGDQSAISALGAYGEKLYAQMQAAETEAERQRIELVNSQSYRLAENSNIAKRISESPAFGMVTGTFQNNILGITAAGAATGAAAGATAGAAAFGIGAIPGAIAGTIGGGIGGYITAQNRERLREDFFDDVEALTSRATLQTLIDAKAQGATFGALSNAELALLIQASNALAQKVITDPETGTVTGITGTPEEVRRAITEVVDYYKRAEIENYTNVFDISEKTQLDSILK